MNHSLGRLRASVQTPAISWLLCLCLVVPVLSAQEPTVSMLQQVRHVLPKALATDLGFFQLRIAGDAFPQASAFPHYLALQLGQGVSLSETLVGVGANQDPIYLPLVVADGSAGLTVNAPADSLSIVRWVAGENQIWLRINHSSSEWLVQDGGSAEPPALDKVVVVAIGAAAAASQSFLADKYLQKLANLPAPTRSPANPLNENATSVLFCGNLFHAALQDSGDARLTSITLTPAFFGLGTSGVETEADPANIVLGSPLNIDIDADPIVVAQQVRGPFTCEMTVDVLSIEILSMCPADRNDNGLFEAAGRLRVAADCDARVIGPGSRLEVAFDARSALRFMPARDAQGALVSAAAVSGVDDTYFLDDEALDSGGLLSRAYCYGRDLVAAGRQTLSYKAYAFMTQTPALPLSFEIKVGAVTDGFMDREQTSARLEINVPGTIDPPASDDGFPFAFQAANCASQPVYLQSVTSGGLADLAFCSQVTFADPVLADWMLAHFDSNADRVIQLEEVQVVTHLDLRGLGITSLAGVEVMESLEVLAAGSNRIADLRPLTSLKRLISLDLHDNLIEDVAVLGLFDHLFTEDNHMLDLSHNRLVDKAENCAVLAALRSRHIYHPGYFAFNPQGGDPLPRIAADWGPFGGLTVLDLVTRINQNADQVSAYTVCGVEKQQEARP